MSNNASAIDHLEDELSALAVQWRRKPSSTIVKKYRHVYEQMIQLGWDQSLDVADHLPSELMPQEYHDLLKERSHVQL